MIHFNFPMKLIPKARPRVTSRGTFMPRDYMNQREHLRARCSGFRHLGNGELKMKVTVTRKGSKTLGKNKFSMPVGDCDNLAGSIMDALEGICYDNDRQITDLRVIKKYGIEDGISVELRRIIGGLLESED